MEMLRKQVEKSCWFRAAEDTAELERVSTAWLRSAVFQPGSEGGAWCAYLRTACKSVIAKASSGGNYAHL